MVQRILTILAALASLAAVAAPADAAQRYAAPGASPSATTCTAIAPCTADVAINEAQVGDEVIVGTGSYTVANPIVVSKAITVHGDLVAPRPVLNATLTAPTFSVTAPNATVSHLEIRNTALNRTAVSLEAGSTLDRIVAISTSGTGIDVLSDATPAIVRNSVAVTHGASTNSGYAALRVSDGPNNGTAQIRNVTAWADAASSVGLRCRTTTATTTIVNTVARGTTFDIDAGTFSGKAPLCPSTTSNARAANSPGFTPAAQADPTFQNPATHDFRPLASSSTVDAGTTAAENGSADLDGAARTQGAATDVGAHEFVPTPPPPADPGPGADADAGAGAGDTTPADGDTGTGETTRAPAATPAAAPTSVPPPNDPPAATDALPPATTPQLGQSVVLDDAGAGTVLVKLPGTNRFVALADAASLPMGTTIDTRKGSVTLSSALPGGKQQTGTFSGGLFEVRQARSGMTDIHLRGDFTKRCPNRTVARAAARKQRKTTVRRLWAKDKGGRFRTHGKNSVATVRGTKWLTEDRCDGTLTKVTEGAVDVKPKRGGKTRRVRAGRSLFVRG